jgi:hypothetical protein
MVLYGPLDSLLRYAPRFGVGRALPAQEDANGAGPLDRFLQGKVRSLTRILRDIGQDVAGRHALSEDVQAGIRRQYAYVKAKLFALDGWGHGRNPGIDARRGALERELDSLNEAVRQERVQCWQDAAALKKEFRAWFKQYADLAQRMALLFPSGAGSTSQKRFQSLQS